MNIKIYRVDTMVIIFMLQHIIKTILHYPLEIGEVDRIEKRVKICLIY
jgi:hypothetical protein